MTRQTKERLIFGIGSPLIVAAILSFSTDFSNTASQEQLKEVKIESKLYTDKVMKQHEKSEEIEREQIKQQYIQIQSDLTIIKTHLIR